MPVEYSIFYAVFTEVCAPLGRARLSRPDAPRRACSARPAARGPRRREQRRPRSPPALPLASPTRRALRVRSGARTARLCGVAQREGHPRRPAPARHALRTSGQMGLAAQVRRAPQCRSAALLVQALLHQPLRRSAAAARPRRHLSCPYLVVARANRRPWRCAGGCSSARASRP